MNALASRRRGFGPFLLASAASNLGDGIRIAALPLLALEVTDDARLVAAVTMLSFLPWVAVGPLVGVLVDRHDRRTMMAAAQCARAIAAAVLAVAITVDRVGVVAVLAVACLIGVGETVVDTSAQAAVPNLVEPAVLGQANARLSLAEQLGNQVVGVAIGAVVFAWNSAAPMYLVAACFAVATGLLALVDRAFQRERAAAGSASMVGELPVGFRHLAGDPFLRPLAWSVAVTNVAVHMGRAVLVILVVDEMASSSATFGWVLSVGALGGVAASVFASTLLRRVGAVPMLGGVHAVFVSGAAIVAAAGGPAQVAVGLVLAAAAQVSYQVSSRVLRQLVTPDEVHGRVVTAFRMVGLSGPVAGAAIGGVVTTAWSARHAFGASVGVMAVAWVFARMAADHAPVEDR